MARHPHTFWLDDTDPEQRALQRWLEDLAAKREKASTIVEALLAHHTGAGGVTLVTLNDKLDHLLARLAAASLSSVGPPPTEAAQGRGDSMLPDGHTYLDALGL